MKSSTQSLDGWLSGSENSLPSQVQSQLDSFAEGVSDVCNQETDGILSVKQAYYQIKTLLDHLKISYTLEELT